ncbi:MAG: C_GCAxxG_C_C family protein [Clostridia bacterium]|nr:C_GCAxxG_C_C family protein [Clostridia bacterium]
MDRAKKAVENHHNGCNCAQAVICAFADITDFTEDELFRLSEAFGGGMGGTQSVCGAVSAMVFLAGLEKSIGIEKLPQTNKKESYKFAAELMAAFEEKNQTIICARLKGEGIRSCDGCIEDAVKILEEKLQK